MMNRAISTALLLASFLASCVTAVPIDSFGINEIYKSDTSKSSGDWESNWDRSSPDTLNRSSQKDPKDDRSVMSGSGTVTFENSECKFTGRVPRLYLNKKPNSPGWEDVEFTAYGKYVADGALKSSSGLTMVARSSHGDFNDGCSAPGYYARIYRSSGEVAFQKEYFHEGSKIIYSNSKRVDLFSGGLPLGDWIGMKFVVYTLSRGRVKLELYLDLDEGESGGDWKLVHSMIDSPGAWKKGNSKTIPSRCEVQNGDTVLGEKKYCFLRTDGDSNTKVSWRKASIRNILPEQNSESAPNPAPVPAPSAPTANACATGIQGEGGVCCASSCGTCGGSGCSRRPGGSQACCTGKIAENSERTCDKYLPPCLIVGDPACATGIEDGGVCCASSCGTCGGSGCSGRPGGAKACCTGTIKGNERTCDEYSPPCIL